MGTSEAGGARLTSDPVSFPAAARVGVANRLFKLFFADSMIPMRAELLLMAMVSFAASINFAFEVLKCTLPLSDIREFSPESWRERIGVVSQDPTLL
jgi:hypothetical protein